MQHSKELLCINHNSVVLFNKHASVILHFLENRKVRKINTHYVHHCDIYVFFSINCITGGGCWQSVLTITIIIFDGCCSNLIYEIALPLLMLSWLKYAKCNYLSMIPGIMYPTSMFWCSPVLLLLCVGLFA